MGDITVENQASAPSNPSAGNRRLYPKSTGWFDLDEAGTEVQLGAGDPDEEDHVIAGRVFA